uniref:Uncharacterized protein n=1 Tax=Rhizophora mucronata TaxID=61149 RepID=A0A2P2NLG5_RHIMU
MKRSAVLSTLDYSK